MPDVVQPTFESLFAPLSWEAFLREVWDQDYRRFPATDGRSFESLFSQRAVEQLLSTDNYRTEFLRLIRDGINVPRARYTTSYRAVRNVLDPTKVTALYGEGSTLEVNALERYWPPLDQFCKHLESVLGCRTDATAFLSPPSTSPSDGKRALHAHYDSQDLLIMQVSGRKRWRLFGTPQPQPLDDQFFDPSTHHPGALREEILMQPGDVLYLLRGTVHDAVTEDEHSLHLAIGIYPFRLHDALVAAVRALADDVRFRQAIMPRAVTGSPEEQAAFGEAFEAARQLAAEALSADAAVAGLREQLARAARPPRDVHFD